MFSRQDGTYLGHADGAAETSADTAIDTLGLSPAGTDTIEPVTLVTVERSLVCTSPVNYASNMLIPASSIKSGSISVAFSNLPLFYQFSNCTSKLFLVQNFFHSSGGLFSKAVGNLRIEGTKRSGDRISRRRRALIHFGSKDVRFLTMGTCFLAATILNKDFLLDSVNDGGLATEIGSTAKTYLDGYSGCG